MLKDIRNIFTRHHQVVNIAAEQLSDAMAEGVNVIVDAILKKKKFLVMGNGGSAADAQHFVAELVGRFKTERKALPAISLVDNNSILTAVSNDYSFSKVFQRQIEALAKSGDVVFGISTSGNSENIIFALQAAKKMGCITFGLLGKDGGKIASVVDYPLIVADEDTPRIQEVHIIMIHIFCEMIERQLLRAGADG